MYRQFHEQRIRGGRPLRLRYLRRIPQGGSCVDGAPDLLAFDQARHPGAELRAQRGRDHRDPFGQGAGDDPRQGHPDLLREPADGGGERGAGDLAAADADGA